ECPMQGGYRTYVFYPTVGSNLKENKMRVSTTIQLTILITSLLSTESVIGQGSIFQTGTGNDYAAAVKSDQFHFYASEGRQENDMWCWGAYINMVLDYQGAKNIEQCEIVKKAFGINNCE